MQKLTIIIGPEPPARLDTALARDVPADAGLSRTRLAALITQGAVTSGGVVLGDRKARVAAGQAVEIAIPDPVASEVKPQPIPLDVIYEDDAVIVVNKPAGMVVHPAPGSPDGTLVNALLAHCGPSLAGIGGEARPGIVHRIDKDTSGLLVAAKTQAAHQALAAQFERHDVARSYLGVCHGLPDRADPRLAGIRGVSFEAGGIVKVTTGLARHRTDRQRQAVTFAGGRHAVTRAKVLEPLGNPPGAALVECRLETGRTHQIRVHMAHIGHGLIGDPVYGGRRKLSARAFSDAAIRAAADFPRQALHAASLGFAHPGDGRMLVFKAPLPADMAALVTALRGGQI